MKNSVFKTVTIAALAFVLFYTDSPAQKIDTRKPVHGKRAPKLLITNALMLDGNAIPAEGPVDIVIQENKIVDIAPAREDAQHRRNADAVIDARDKYVLPGFINMHGHIHHERAGKPLPFEYIYKLWLGSGITTVRDVGSDIDRTVDERKKSASNDIVAPRIWLYMWVESKPTEEQLRQELRRLKKRGADGLKIWNMNRDRFLIAADEAKKLGLKIAHHVGVQDANAWDDAAGGTTTIEHWYGVPDAALKGVQNFPAEFNYSNELHRFRYAGRLWREADPEKLKRVLQNLVDKKVAWDPTLCIYEASRDLQRAVTQPWFRDYLHPSLEAFFTPSPEFHGSFFFGWTNTDEVFWKENYRIWMTAVKRFAEMGGLVTTGEDAGYIYQMYGFGYLRELELHQEAGFHPLEVIQHATANGAQALGMQDKLGRVRIGYLADLLVVNGNPLENLHTLFPRGIHETLDKQSSKGGIEWTIKDGIPYHAPTLFAEVKTMVAAAKKKL